MQVKSIAECSKGSILQYFRHSLSYHLSLRSLFCLSLSGRFKQVLFSLSYWCLVMDVWLFLAVQFVCLRLLIVVFPDHTYYFYCSLFNFQRVNQLVSPTHLWQPNNHEARETYRLQPYRYAATFLERTKLNAIGPKDNPLI